MWKYKIYGKRNTDSQLTWRIRVSIPVLLACKASALPFELIPLAYGCYATKSISIPKVSVPDYSLRLQEMTRKLVKSDRKSEAKKEIGIRKE